MISPENLPEVLQTLKTRFGQPKHVIKSMIEKCQKVPAVREDKLETLIEFGMSVTNMTSTIKALACNSHMSNPILLEELESKLPSSMKIQWGEWIGAKSEKPRDLSSFTEWIKIKTDLACEFCPPKIQGEDRGIGTKIEHRRDRKRMTGIHVVEASPGQSSERPRREKKCAACGSSDHWISNCLSFPQMQVNERWNKIKAANLCACCLRPGHRAIACRSKKACGEDGCDKVHHQLLHNLRPPRR